MFWFSLMMMMMMMTYSFVYIRATDWVHIVGLQNNTIIRQSIQIRSFYLRIVVANVIITFEGKEQLFMRFNPYHRLNNTITACYWLCTTVVYFDSVVLHLPISSTAMKMMFGFWFAAPSTNCTVIWHTARGHRMSHFGKFILNL